MRKAHLVGTVPLLLLSSILSGCRSQPEAAIGKTYFHFDRDAVTHLWMVSNATGATPWSIQLRRDSSASAYVPAWRVESAPDPLRDRMADTAFIEHLLDSIQSLSPRIRAKSGFPETFGLKPPRTRIEWTYRAETSDAKTKTVTTHFELGDLVSSQGTLARFATLADAAGIYEVEGATLAMLQYAGDWAMFRWKRLTVWETDDIDLIETSLGKRFERAGSEWDLVTKGKHRPASGLSAAIENLTHQRVKNFLDRDSEQAELNAATARLIPFKLTLEGRKAGRQVLEFYSLPATGGDQARILVKNLVRGDHFLEAYPEVLIPLRSLGFTLTR